jgi:hypothetical protein
VFPTTSCSSALLGAAEHKHISTLYRAAEDKPTHGSGSLVPSDSTRRVEKGFLTDHHPLAFVSVSEGFPFWLLGLEPGMVASLHFPGSRNASKLRASSVINGVASSLITKAVTYLGINKIHFGSGGAYSDIRLVSGSMDFLIGFGGSARVGTRALLLVDEPWRARRLPKKKHPTIRWVRGAHAQFGGSTDYDYLFGVVGLTVAPTLSKLAHSVGHIFDHSLQPSSTAIAPKPGSYTLDSQLRIRDLTTPVAFRTHFARNGWGLRTLNLDEIGIAFGLSSRLRTGSSTSSTFPLPPVQGL